MAQSWAEYGIVFHIQGVRGGDGRRMNETENDIFKDSLKLDDVVSPIYWTEN